MEKGINQQLPESDKNKRLIELREKLRKIKLDILRLTLDRKSPVKLCKEKEKLEK